MSKKPIIFLCDDELEVTERFKLWHGENWDVRTINDGTKLGEELRKLKDNNETPDIILIDQQYKGDNHNEIKENEWKSSGKQLVEAIKELQKLEIKSGEEGIYENFGVDYLKKARKIFPDTPIAIYTTYGIALADNKTLEDVAIEKGEWLKKGCTRNYEDNRLKNMMRPKRNDEIIKNSENVGQADDKSKIFINVPGNNNLISVASDMASITVTQNNSVDYEKLKKYGVEEQQIEELKVIEKETDENILKEKILSWIGKVSAAVAARGLYDKIPAIIESVKGLF